MQNAGLLMKKIVVTASLPGEALKKLEKKFKVNVFNQKKSLSEEELIKILEGADGAITLLSDPLTKNVLEKTKLKIISNYAVGYNNIDVNYATEKGIVVTNPPDVLTDATADLAFALILSVARRIVEGDIFTRKGKFKGWLPQLMLGVDLKGKTLGIIGMGRIGKAVARRALPFGMRIVYFQRKPLIQSEEDSLGAKYTSLESLLKISDIVSLHCSLTKETHRMLNRERIFSMKRGAILINTSRGQVVEEESLCDALESHLFGAGLDVYENEPLINKRLLKMKNVVLLPHIGSAGKETREEMAEIAVSNILAFFEGKRPPNIVPEQSDNKK
ncbi:MAG: D-glycerate dehydrogenase [Acidobacteria bacterium]|nr:D-glycerate dehydrogenase [Acidobacteriota bacterium]